MCLQRQQVREPKALPVWVAPVQVLPVWVEPALQVQVVAALLLQARQVPAQKPELRPAFAGHN